MLLSLVAIMAFFQYMTDGTLLKPLNLTNLVLQNSYIVIMALGMLLVIVAGHIDLSVGSVVRLHRRAGGGDDGATTTGTSCPRRCCACSPARVIGAAQGWFVAYLKIPSFIVTLAGMLVFKGLALALLQGQSVGPFPDAFQLLSSGFIPDFFNGETLRISSLALGASSAVALFALKLRERARGTCGTSMEDEPGAFFLAKNVAFAAVIVWFCWMLASYKGLPNVLIVMVVLMLVYDFVTRRTTIGRRIYALGGNARRRGCRASRRSAWRSSPSSTWACWPRSPASSSRPGSIPQRPRPAWVSSWT